jgi:hypothetical protein
VKKFVTTFILLILGLTLVVPAFGQTEAQADYALDVSGYTWDHYILKVSIFPQENESWWDPSYLDAVFRGVGQWNDAIQDFASNYTEFSYISRLRFVPIITHEVVSDLDIYVGWVAECEGGEAAIGVTENFIEYPCTALNSTVCLAAKGPSGYVMTEVDMQNIVVHELGHTLALYHSNYSDDVMYPSIGYVEKVRPLSSLDIYAVAQNFEWLSNSTQFTSSEGCPQKGSLTLPPSISYVHLSIDDENHPSPAQDLIEQVNELFLSPEVLSVIVVLVTLLVVVVVIVKRRKKPQENPDTLT